jgi:hypothetical protein
MNDVRFFLKAIQFLFACAFLWFLTMMVTGQWWVFPLAFVGLCAYVIYDGRQKRKLAEQVATCNPVKEATRRAEEARATADRLAEEARIAADRYARAIAEARTLNKLTEEGVALFCNPN